MLVPIIALFILFTIIVSIVGIIGAIVSAIQLIAGLLARNKLVEICKAALRVVAYIALAYYMITLDTYIVTKTASSSDFVIKHKIQQDYAPMFGIEGNDKEYITTKYYLYLAARQPQGKDKTYKVSKMKFDDVSIGDVVQITTHEEILWGESLGSGEVTLEKLGPQS